jgi:hypothetical protein
MISDFFVVSVEDTVIQLTTYIVRADDLDHARRLVAEGIYAFESEREIVDTIATEIKTVEGLGK